MTDTDDTPPPFSRTPVPDRLPSYSIHRAVASDLPVEDGTADVVVTSPPYWKKRDYGFEDQIGQESTPDEYVDHLRAVLDECARVVGSTGTAFVNIGDTYCDRSLVGIPYRFAAAAHEAGWAVRNEITWKKTGGMPDAVDNRFAQRTESIFFLVRDADDYYQDRFGYRTQYGKTGDVWEIDFEPDASSHLAPFPSALVERALVFACPPLVCTECGRPYERATEVSFSLDIDRPQARRAMERYQSSELEREHLEAVRAVGLGDAGKTSEVQTGTGRNTERVTQLAHEARSVLGSYAREFVQPARKHRGWAPTCDETCSQREVAEDGAAIVADGGITVAKTRPGVVVDPFVGTGTTVEVARQYGLSAIGTDLDPPSDFQFPLGARF